LIECSWRHEAGHFKFFLRARESKKAYVF